MDTHNIKVKIYWLFPVNKRQFIVIYSIFIFLFLALAIIFQFTDMPVSPDDSSFTKFTSRNFSLLWIICLVWMLIEGQFFWQKFTRRQLEMIERQREEIEQINKELHTRNEEIVAQRDEIEAQNDQLVEQKEQIERQSTEIMDSIRYAFRIQTAILPPDYHVKNCLKESFILYMPKAVVSGDFYFVEKVGNKVIAAAVDCTGHGVPGAMMSVIGYNLLNQAVKMHHITDPAGILEFLDNGVTEILRQTHGESGVNDGMDLSVCVVEEGSRTIKIAGAFNSAYVINNGEFMEVKADKLPIGVNYDGLVDHYTCHTLDLLEGDMVYIFSDGYADQFGGPKGKKFKYKSIKDVMLEHHKRPVAEQKEIFAKTFRDWQGNLEQVDDVLIIGIKVL